VVLHTGIPLFPADGRELSLTLKNNIPFESGLVQLHYESSRVRG
jgi:hypothetical protein